MTHPPCPTCGRPQVLPHEIPTVKETEEMCLHRGNAYCRAASAGRQAALTWRPMNEAFPKDEWLVAREVGYAQWYPATYDSYDGCWYDDHGNKRSPTHWLPLPEPPKEWT